MTHSHVFSRAFRPLHVITSSSDWFTVLSVSVCDWLEVPSWLRFYDTQLKTALYLLSTVSKFSAPTIAFLAFWLAKKLRLYNNYSMSPSWIWSDKITNERVARVGYNHFISNKGKWNNCFSKFSNRVCRWFLFPQCYKASGKRNWRTIFHMT